MMDVTAKISYSSNALLALFGLFSLQQWAILIGIILSIVTFGVNAWYRKRMLDMTQCHQRKMRDIQERKKDEDQI